MTYDFATQLTIGKRAEAELDRYFSRWYSIEEVPRDVERKIHADRVFITPHGRQVLVEYKTDFMCHKTGNLVFEIVSVDTDNTPGWALSTMADMLVWWITGTSEVVAMEMYLVRDTLPAWQEKYRKVYIPNKTYNTVGILVPLIEVKQICKWVGLLSPGGGNPPPGNG